MERLSRAPIGMTLAVASKAVTRAFDDRLAEAGGSRPTWSILLTLRTHEHANQRELADAVGIRGATLTHHLNGMAAAGLIERHRDPGNRRTQQVALTGAGERMFDQLAQAAQAHDARLRAGFSDAELDVLESMLGRLAKNVS